MRGAVLAPGGKSILALRSHRRDGRIPHRSLPDRGRSGDASSAATSDYVVTEYGIAYLHGKNIRERAMDAHRHRPSLRPGLVDEARRWG